MEKGITIHVNVSDFFAKKFSRFFPNNDLSRIVGRSQQLLVVRITEKRKNKFFNKIKLFYS
jgi:hypothetical protein